MRGNNNKIVRQANRHLVINTIRAYEPVTTEEIIEKTRLSYPTVLNLVKQLLEENLIQKTGFGESTGGRQPALLSLNAQSYYAVGVDLEFPPVRIVVSDLKGNIVFSKKEEYDNDSPGTDVIDSLVVSLEQCLSGSGIPVDKVIGIGIGLPGIIDINKDISVNIERINGWVNVPLKEIIQKKFNIPVYVRNDVHLAGLVEKKLFVDSGINNFAYIGIREGIGMAVFINGSLYEGNTGNAGFLGHMTIDVNGGICKCGRKGCLETTCSKKSILDESPETAAYNLGIGIANVVKLFDISHIVVGGLPDIREADFLDSVRTTVRENAPGYISNDITIVGGKLKDEAFALGGCFFVIDRFYMEPKLKLFS